MTAPRSPESLAVLADHALDGRTALVTGGGGGIGRACALLLHRLGADVLIVGRTEESLAETVALAAGPSPRTMTSRFCDIRETDQVDELLEEAMARLGRIDILVNNAGGQFQSPAEKVSYGGFRAVTRLNLDATWYLTTRVATASMLPSGYGKIVNIVMSPRRGIPGMSHASAARAAVESLTNTLAVEWGPRGVRVVSVSPGFVHTDALERYGVDIADLASVAPLGRPESADEVAALVGFLVSAGGDYITGTTISADGGLNVAPPRPYVAP